MSNTYWAIDSNGAKKKSKLEFNLIRQDHLDNHWGQVSDNKLHSCFVSRESGSSSEWPLLNVTIQ